MDAACDEVRQLTDANQLQDGRHRYLTSLLARIGQNGISYKDVVMLALQLIEDGMTAVQLQTSYTHSFACQSCEMNPTGSTPLTPA